MIAYILKGTVRCLIKIEDGVKCVVEVNIVPDSVEDIPLLVDRTFIDQLHVKSLFRRTLSFRYYAICVM